MKKSFFWLLCLLLSTNLFSQQLSNYAFVAEAGTFTAITGGTQLLAAGDDEEESAITNIGFEFWYLGNRYTQFSVSDNGVLGFGGTVLPATTTDNLPNGNARNVLAPLWDDQAVGATGSVKYLVTGTAPNRVLTVEWLNMEWSWGATAPVISYQVRLFETSGVIEYQYQRNAAAVNAGSASIGMNATATGANNYASLSGSGTAPTVSYTAATNNINTKPANGQIYRFTPPNPTLDPTGLGVSCITNTAITLNWTNATDTKRVRTAIYRSTDNITFTYIGMVNAGVQTYTATGLTANTHYYFQIAAVSEGFVGNKISTDHPTQGAVINATSTSVCQGSTTELSGSGYFGTITWQSSPDNAAWTTIAGASGTPYTTDPLTASTYFRFVIDSDGCTTNSPSILVNVSPQGGTAVSSANPVCLGGTTNLSLTGSTGTVQWQSSFDDVTYSNISGATTNPYTSGAINQITYYRAVLSDGTCPDAVSSSVMVEVDSIPVFVSPIKGPAFPCALSTVTYSVDPIANATGYTWTVPANYTVTAGAGTNSITVLLGLFAAQGNVTVTATNSCGTSSAITKSVTPVNGAPATPGTISGNATACEGATEDYSIAAVPNTNFYTWTLPAGSTLNSGDSTTQIETTFGSTSGNITVTATNGCGTSAASTLAITLTPNVTPAVTIAITDGSSPACNGTSVTYTATPTNGGVNPTYAWYVNGVQVATTIDYTSTTFADGDQIYCEMTSDITCVTQPTATSSVMTQNIQPNVVPTISISNTTAMPVCDGDTIAFTSAVTNEGSNPIYDWQVNGVSHGIMATFSPDSLSNGDTVICYLTTDVACAAPNPAMSDTIFILENENPTAVFTGDTTLCTGESQNLNIQFTGTAPFTIYGDVDGTTDTLSGISVMSLDILVSNPGVYTIVKVLDANCSTDFADSITIEEVTPVQIVNLMEMCSPDGTSYVVTFDLVGGDSTTYSVTGDNGTLTGTSFVSDTIPTDSSYIFIADDQFSCSADTAMNTVNCPCITDATISGDTTLCPGDSTYLHIDFTGVAPFTFVLDNGTSIDTLMTNAMFYDTLVFGAGTYYLTEVWNQYCNVLLTDSAVVDFFTSPTITNVMTSCDYATDTYTVTFDIVDGDSTTYFVTGNTGTLTGTSFVSDPIQSGTAYTFTVADSNQCMTSTINDSVTCVCPAAGEIAGGGTVCEGDSVALNFTFTGTAPFDVKYTSGNNDTLTLQATTDTTIYVFSSGTYSLISVMDSICDGSVSGSATVVVNTTPATPVVTENNFVLTSSAANNNQWYMNGGILVGETNQTYTATQNGSYFVLVTENGCVSDTSNIVVIDDVSINELDLTGAVIIYPNPTSGKFDVQYPQNVGFQYFELRDLSGRLIAEQTTNSFDLSELPMGTYILGIYFENQQVFKKVVKR